MHLTDAGNLESALSASSCRAHTVMLHIHFGAGRLGLGLPAPFFQKPGSELFLLNRAQSGANPTGSTQLAPERRAQLLSAHSERKYGLQTPGELSGVRETVRYDGFRLYSPPDIEEVTGDIVRESRGKAEGVVVTASVLSVSNYQAIVRALNVLCAAKQSGQEIGDIFLVACENTVSAHEIFEAESLGELITPETRCHVKPVHALVDRMCVGLEEYCGDDPKLKGPAVLVRAEEYGSLKLELRPETESLVDLCRESKIEFSRHLDVEKKIKGWLLNGTHWLIALTAFQASEGNTELKLNKYLAENPERREFAAEVIQEIRDGIEIILCKDPEYADFVKDVPPGQYLDGAAQAILRRFSTTEDTIARILARFRAPTPHEVTTIESFVKRFFDRVDPAISAYESEKGVAPPATSHGLLSLCRLVASGTFVNTQAAA